MQFSSLNTIVPPLLFFIAFFIIFSFVELLIVLILNYLSRHYWEFVVDHIMRPYHYHKKLVQGVIAVLLITFIVVLLVGTSVFDVLLMASPELKFLSVVLAFLMAVMHWINTKRISQVVLQRMVYHLIFFCLSLVLYVSIILTAHSSYPRYRDFIDSRLVEPTLHEVEQQLEDSEKKHLLKQFTQRYLDGDCETVDYKEEAEAGVVNLVYVSHDPMLAYGVEVDPEDSSFFLRGEECTDGQNTFLLNANGNWYWVIPDDPKN